jgi:hypothetical protein
LICSYGGEVAVQWHGWIVMRQHGARKWLNFTKEGWLPAKRMPCGGCGFNAAAN